MSQYLRVGLLHLPVIRKGIELVSWFRRAILVCPITRVMILNKSDSPVFPR